jgi:RNA polymerase sigma-70 factor (ECF subfamily)
VAQTHLPARRRSSASGEALLRALRSGDDASFARVVDAWTPVMLRMALVHVPSRAVAEEVVQEAWLTMLRDLHRFEGRSSLRTWVLGIVVNMARARARAERRSTPVPLDDGPVPWPTPEDELLAHETLELILHAIAALPPAQREVLVLRDLAGWPSDETCNGLGLSDTNQRVLLHRARSRVRQTVERRDRSRSGWSPG